MVYDIIALTVAVLGGLLLFMAARALLGSNWFLAWLRGTLGLLLLLAAAFSAMAAWDLLGYEQILEDKPVAVIRLTHNGEKRYTALVTWPDTQDAAKEYVLQGDQWQLDARLLKWSDALSRLGLKPGYRLGRLAGRYYSLEDERNLPRTLYDLGQSGAWLDLWSLYDRIDSEVPWLDALYGNAVFAPMEDGAVYEISLSASGLVSRPMNEAARKALNNWP